MNPGSSCPPATTLSAWLDDELSAVQSATIRGHLEECAACREQTLAWVHAAQELQPGPTPRHESADECLDDEMLVAYSDAELSATEATQIEEHLGVCDHCLGEVQRLVRLSVAVGGETVNAAAYDAVQATQSWEPERHVAGVRSRLAARLGERARSVAQILFRPWPVFGAVAAAAVLVIVMVRLLPSGNVGPVQFRGVTRPPKVEINADDVPAHAGPSDDTPIVARLGRGVVGTKLAELGDWTRIELPNGRRVWVRSAHVRSIRTERR